MIVCNLLLHDFVPLLFKFESSIIATRGFFHKYVAQQAITLTNMYTHYN